MKFKMIFVGILMIFALVGVASADTGENLSLNNSLSVVAPYIGNLTYGTAASGGVNTYGLDACKQARIRQNGDIVAVQFGITNTSSINRLNVCIWRKNDSTAGTYTLVAKSADLHTQLGSDGVQNVYLDTPIPSLEGDYIGYEVNTSSYCIQTSTVPAETTDAVLHHGTGRTFTVGDEFNWTANATNHVSGKIFTIRCFMPAVDTAFIGDSVISGRTNHTSYVDPANYYQPNSSMSYQWGLLTGRTYQNLGWRGQTTTEIRNRFVADAIALHPTNIVIEGGLNDHTKSITKETTLDNLMWMINQTLDIGATPYVIEVPPSETYGVVSDFEDWDWINAQLTAEYDNNASVHLIHIRDYVGQYNTSGPEGNLWAVKSEYDPGDHLHYNVLGYQEWARVLSHSIKPVMGIPYKSVGYSVDSSGSITWYSRALTKTDTSIPFTLVPDTGTVNVTVQTWDTNRKVWNESSATAGAITQHIIGNFPANTSIQILRDGTNYAVVTSNSTGYIDWTYSGGYSEHEFEATAGEPVILTVTSLNALNSSSEDATNITLSAETQYTGMGALYNSVKSTISSGYTLASLITLIIGAYALFRYMGYM